MWGFGFHNSSSPKPKPLPCPLLLGEGVKFPPLWFGQLTIKEGRTTVGFFPFPLLAVIASPDLAGPGNLLLSPLFLGGGWGGVSLLCHCEESRLYRDDEAICF